MGSLQCNSQWDEENVKLIAIAVYQYNNASQAKLKEDWKIGKVFHKMKMENYSNPHVNWRLEKWKSFNGEFKLDAYKCSLLKSIFKTNTDKIRILESQEGACCIEVKEKDGLLHIAGNIDEILSRILKRYNTIQAEQELRPMARDSSFFEEETPLLDPSHKKSPCCIIL